MSPLTQPLLMGRPVSSILRSHDPLSFLHGLNTWHFCMRSPIACFLLRMDMARETELDLISGCLQHSMH